MDLKRFKEFERNRKAGVYDDFKCKRCKKNQPSCLNAYELKYGLEYKNICILCITADEKVLIEKQKVLIEKQKWDALSTYEKMKKIIFPFSGQLLNLIFLGSVFLSLGMGCSLLFYPEYNDNLGDNKHWVYAIIIALPILAYGYCVLEQDQEDDNF